MTDDLSQPQKLHPLTLVLGPIRSLRGWVVPIVIAMAFRSGTSPVNGFFTGALPIVAIAAVVTGVQAVQLMRVRWWVRDGAFQMRVGVLQLEARSVPIDRIQNVDISEPLLPRALGLAEVKVETAGSSGGNLALRYVTLADANRLREMLITSASEADGSFPVADDSEVLVQTSIGELFIAGATANRIGTIVLLAGAAWGWVIEAGVDPTDALSGVNEAVVGVDPAVAILGGVVVALVVGWVASIGATLLRFFEFRLTAHGTDLRRQHGLLSRSSGIIPLKRVQAVRIERPWLRRLFRRASMVADTAGSVAAATDTGTGVLAPILRNERVPSLTSRVLDMDDPLGRRLEPVSRLAIRRGFVRLAIPVVVAAVAVGVLLEPMWAAGAIPALAVGYSWAYARFRAIGYHVDDELVIAQAGILTQRQWLVPTAKVQSTVLRSSVFQRRLGLATLSVDTAGPGTRKVTVIDLELSHATELATHLSEVSAQFGLVSDGV